MKKKPEKVNWIELSGVLGPDKMLTSNKDIKAFLKGEIAKEGLIDTDGGTYFCDDVAGKKFLVGTEVVEADC